MNLYDVTLHFCNSWTSLWLDTRNVKFTSLTVFKCRAPEAPGAFTLLYRLSASASRTSSSSQSKALSQLNSNCPLPSPSPWCPPSCFLSVHLTSLGSLNKWNHPVSVLHVWLIPLGVMSSRFSHVVRISFSVVRAPSCSQSHAVLSLASCRQSYSSHFADDDTEAYVKTHWDRLSGHGPEDGAVTLIFCPSLCSVHFTLAGRHWPACPQLCRRDPLHSFNNDCHMSGK